jgi:hypothetical protein
VRRHDTLALFPFPGHYCRQKYKKARASFPPNRVAQKQGHTRRLLNQGCASFDLLACGQKLNQKFHRFKGASKSKKPTMKFCF